ncbi:MAG: glutamate racemase [Planctomycetota bacterium]
MEPDRMDFPSRPIAVFDSGLGGLTVVRELTGALPHEHVVYLGDSARVPYGIKSLETVREFALQCAAFLMQFDPKLLVVACNTASAAAIEEVQAHCSVPVIDVIRPGAAAALAATDHAIGVIGTEATIASQAYQRALTALDAGRPVFAAACPLLVPLVEEGRDEADPVVTSVVAEYLAGFANHDIHAMILGCTHYPLLAGAIRQAMGPEVALVSSAAAAAEQVTEHLSDQPWPPDPIALGQLHCYTTDNPERFARLGERFGGRPIDHVQHVGTDELQALLA